VPGRWHLWADMVRLSAGSAPVSPRRDARERAADRVRARDARAARQHPGAAPAPMGAQLVRRSPASSSGSTGAIATSRYRGSNARSRSGLK